MKSRFYYILIILVSSMSLLKAQKNNALEIGIGTSLMSEIFLKKGFRFEAEYSRYLHKRIGITANININYCSAVAFDTTRRTGISGFYVVGKDIPSPILETIRSSPIQTLPAHTTQILHATVLLNGHLALIKKEHDELILMTGLMLSYATQTQLQQDGFIYKSTASPQIPEWPVKFVVPHYLRYIDAGFNTGLKYKHYFNNDFSIGARAAMEYTENWGIFSLTATCGVRF